MISSPGSGFQADITFGFLEASTQSSQAFSPLLISNEAENTMLRSIRHELSRSHSFTMSVAFISTGGLAFLKQALLDFDGRGTIVTSTYLGFNSPDAFRELLTLDRIDVLLYPDESGGFHPKGYVFEQKSSTTAIIGSSNLTANALLKNKEWNLRFSAFDTGDIAAQLRAEIKRQVSVSRPLTSDWIDSYELTYRSKPKDYPRAETPQKVRPIQPNAMQREALEAISTVRASGASRAVVVSATGTGKTILAALDVRAAQPQKMLFIVHREQILNDAMQAFEAVFDSTPGEIGKVVGAKGDFDHRFVFTTIQSLSRPGTLEKIAPDHFDYVLIDEVHRAGAESYLRVIEHLTPRFLLGLTATPERTDDFNVFELFDYNVPYEIRLQAALEAEMLSPFHYFGVTDYVDLAGNTIQETSDFNRLVESERVEHIVRALQTYGHTGSVRGLMFCSRNDEAAYLAQCLNTRQVNGARLRTRALSGQDSVETRAAIVEDLEKGNIDYILTVDIFNEGIDIPQVNQVVMLRQTKSSIVFTQQLGRGLRKAPGKDHLRVIDFIGNYANNFLIPIALLGDSSLNKDSIKQGLVQADQAGAIAGLSSINFDQISRERIFRSLDQTKLDGMPNLKRAFAELQNRLGQPPLLLDFARFNTVDPVVIANKAGNYWTFLNRIKAEEITPTSEQSAFLTFLSRELLNGKRPHELVLLRELVTGSAIPIDDLASVFERVGCVNDGRTVESVLRVLKLTFHTASERDRYGNLALISTNSAGEITLAPELQGLLLSDTRFHEHFTDALATGLYLAQRRDNWLGTLRPGQLYSRKDACRLLNWESNEYSTIYGYKVDHVSSSCPIFVTYHKGDEVSASTRYNDELLDPSTLRWFTRSRRTLQSAEVSAIVNNEVPLHLFAKKDDAEGSDFYYLGRATSSKAVQEQMPGGSGKPLDVVTMNLELDAPIGEGLYDYLTSKIEAPGTQAPFVPEAPRELP